MQALADCTGLPVEVAAVPEGAALGAAFIARCTAGLDTDITDATPVGGDVAHRRARPAWVEAAQPRYERFRQLTASAVT